MPARYVFLDEVDAYPASADEEGDPVTLAEARTTTFSHRRKVFMVSTPTIRGLSRIEREFEAIGPAAVLRALPALRRDAVAAIRPAALGKGRPETAAYHCEGCERPIAEHHKTRDAGPTANGGRPLFPPIRMPSASTSRRFTRPWAGKAGPPSRGNGWRPKGRTRRCAPRATRFWARHGSRAATRRNGSGWRNGARPGSRAQCPWAGCS